MKLKSSYFLTFFLDIFFLAIIGVFSGFLMSPYFTAAYIHVNYPDWIVHAFRVKMLHDFGMQSWTHIWSNGISIWKAYQFIPHYLTLLVVNIFHVSITRAMVLLTIGSYAALRVCIYVTMRLLGFTPLTACILSLLSFDTAQYLGAIGDYSIMFGFLFFPLVLFLWTKFHNGKAQFFYPYICGICFYIHPLLGFISLALFFATIIFSKQKFFSLKTIIQISITLIASSLFWVPIACKTAYLYSEPGVANQTFLALVLSKFDYFGLSLVILLCLFMSIPQIIMPVSQKFLWVKTLCVTITVYFLLVVIGITTPLPRFISQFQYTRGTMFIGIGALYAIAPLLQRVLSLKRFFITLLIATGVSLSLVESIYFASIFAPPPSGGYDNLVRMYPKDLSNGRIFAENIGALSYYSPETYRFPYSYMSHLDSNQIPPRLSQILTYASYSTLVPQVNIDRLTDYVKITGTKYLFLDESSPFTQTFLMNQKTAYSDLGKVTTSYGITHVFQTQWKPKDALLIDPRYEYAMKHFPFTLNFSQPDGQVALDSNVHQFVTTLDKPENQLLSIQYPAQDQIAITLPTNALSNLVYIDESFDKEWKAFYNNTEQIIKPVGPNYMLIALQENPNGGTLLLKHTWPVSFYLSWYFLIAIPIILLLHQIGRFLFFKILVKEKHS